MSPLLLTSIGIFTSLVIFLVVYICTVLFSDKHRTQKTPATPPRAHTIEEIDKELQRTREAGL